MQIIKQVRADHHAFVFGSPDADPTDVTHSGSVLDFGPGFVRVLTGIANGPVSVVVQDHTPLSDPVEWDVVEECELRIEDGFDWLPAPGDVQSPPAVNLANGTYGVRVSARGRDALWDLTVPESGEQYLIEVWPTQAPVLFRQLRKVDSAWPDETDEHRPDEVGDPGDDASRTIKATLEFRDTAYGRKVVRLFDLDDPLDAADQWGGRPPTTALRELAPGPVRNAAQALATVDRDFLDSIVAKDDNVQRMIARWSARRAYLRAGVAELGWVAPALEALDRGAELPPPFANGGDLYTQFERDPRVPKTPIEHYAGGESHLPWTFAMSAAQSAQAADPLQAALATAMAAVMTYGTEFREFVREARNTFFPNRTT